MVGAARRLEVARQDRLVHPVLLEAVGVRHLRPVARVVEEEDVASPPPSLRCSEPRLENDNSKRKSRQGNAEEVPREEANHIC